MTEARYTAPARQDRGSGARPMSDVSDAASRRSAAPDRRSSPRSWPPVGPRRSRAAAATACSSDCCPDRVRASSTPARPASGMHAAGGGAGDVAALIDHTLLKPDATRAEIETLCREAAEYRFATVCVNPTWVALAARAAARHAASGSVRWSASRSARRRADVKHYETRRAIFDGATEIDMVINVGALKSGDCDWSSATSRRWRQPAATCGVAQQGDHRGGAADRRREGDGLHAGQGGRRRLRQDLDRVRPGRRHRRPTWR